MRGERFCKARSFKTEWRRGGFFCSGKGPEMGQNCGTGDHSKITVYERRGGDIRIIPERGQAIDLLTTLLTIFRRQRAMNAARSFIQLLLTCRVIAQSRREPVFSASCEPCAIDQPFRTPGLISPDLYRPPVIAFTVNRSSA